MATAKSTPELDKALEPVKALNNLMLDNAAKLVDINFDVARRYTDMTLQNWREALDIKDAAALQAYVARQPQAFKDFAETVSADTQAVVKLGVACFEEAGKIVSTGIRKAA